VGNIAPGVRFRKPVKAVQDPAGLGKVVFFVPSAMTVPGHGSLHIDVKK
jgi:hypothetical protein